MRYKLWNNLNRMKSNHKLHIHKAADGKAMVRRERQRIKCQRHSQFTWIHHTNSRNDLVWLFAHDLLYFLWNIDKSQILLNALLAWALWCFVHARDSTHNTPYTVWMICVPRCAQVKSRKRKTTNERKASQQTTHTIRAYTAGIHKYTGIEKVERHLLRWALDPKISCITCSGV